MGRKWNNIKMKKAAQDKLRSANYTKVLREITLAVRRSGPHVDSNFALKIALLKAREYNVPKDNVERAIKKGQGEGDQQFEEIAYEGYGVEGIAVFVEAATDNPTRTISNIRSYFNRWGGSIGKEGCLQFVFNRKAVYRFEKGSPDIDTLSLELIDAGVEDIKEEEGLVEVTGPVEQFKEIHETMERLKIKPTEAGLERIPLLMKEANSKDSYQKILKLVDALEEDDDVQEVYHNMEFNESFELE